jgi:protein SMG6
VLKLGPEELMAAAVSAVPSASPSVPPSVSNMSAKSSSASEKHVARIDGSLSSSIGLAAGCLAGEGGVGGIARDWYANGLADTPGNGKLHHHLGLLTREKDGEELRAVSHFVKRQAFTPWRIFY